MLAVDNVLVFSFARAHPCGWVCSFLLLHVLSFRRRPALFCLDLLTSRRYWLIGAAVDSSLDLSVRTCVRSSPPGVAARERRLTLPVQCEALVASRTWLFTC